MKLIIFVVLYTGKQCLLNLSIEFMRLQKVISRSPLKLFKKFIKVYWNSILVQVLVLDDCLSLECFRIPHFYFSFYVYKYATGISAAYALADRVLSGSNEELNDYLNFLKSGGSKYPIDLLKGAGVDMDSPEPVSTALSKFSALVDELESLTINN